MNSVNLIKPYFIENRLKILAGLFCLLATDMFQLLLPRVIKWVIDDLTAFRADLAGLSVYTLYIVGIALMIGLFRYGWIFCFMGMARRVEEGLRNQLLAHIQRLPASYFDKTRTGDLMAHATNDMQQIRMATGIGLVTIIDTLFLGTTAIIFMAFINAKLTIFSLLPMPLIILASWGLRKKMHRMYKTVQASFSDLTEGVRERFAGIRIIKAYTLEDEATSSVKAISREHVGKNLRLAKITGAYSSMIAFLSNLTFVMVLYIGGRQTILTEITPGDFVAFNTYIGLLIWPMTAIGSVANLIQRGKASLDRINTILQTQPEITDTRKPKPLRQVRQGIAFENVTFAYEALIPNEKHQGEESNIPHPASRIQHPASSIQHPASRIQHPALSQLDIRLEKGKTLGIIGPPGSGKTSLLNLLPRFYDVSEGRVLIDGTDIREFSLRDLRSLIAYVPQEPFLFAGTIRENITFGKENAGESELADAVCAAALDETIKAFPSGFETIVGEKGIVLSGGQKQRVALARTLICERPILLLDDPISQVDTGTASRIVRTIRSLAASRTTLIVSHRISAVRFADQIITLKEGRMTASGTHDELAGSLDSYYAKTFRMQQVEDHMKAL